MVNDRAIDYGVTPHEDSPIPDSTACSDAESSDV